MSTAAHVQLGKKGEDLACTHLEQKGYTILERNYHFEKAEVDLIAYFGFEIIFVEVKTRTSDFFGQPEEFVDTAKQKLIFKAAQAWLYERKMEGSPIRFDVVSVKAESETTFIVTHFENAF